MGAEICTDRASGKAPGLAARRLALDLLHDVLEHHRMLSDALEMRADQVAALAPSDRARAQRLATETLRHLHRADACLRPMLQRPPAATTKLILRLATVELCQTGGEAHGVVNSAVTLARRAPRAARQAKLVNAVLRRMADEGPDRWARLTAPARLPDWLRGRAQSAYGARVTAAIEAARARCARPLQRGRDRLRACLGSGQRGEVPDHQRRHAQRDERDPDRQEGPPGDRAEAAAARVRFVLHESWTSAQKKSASPWSATCSMESSSSSTTSRGQW